MRVLISGGGIAGLTLAFWLRQYGHQVLVIEKGSQLRADGDLIDFSGAGYDIAERMGILSSLSFLPSPVTRLSFLSASGQERFSLPYSKVRSLFRERHLYLLQGDVERVLYSKAKELAEIRFHTTIEAFQQEIGQVRAKLSDGSIESVDLFVCAEGLHSPTRRVYFGPNERTERPLGYRTVAFAFHGAPIKNLERSTFYTMTAPLHHMSLCSLRGGRLAARFIYKADNSPKPPTWDAAQKELRERYRGMEWLVPEILAKLSDAEELYVDDVSQVVLPRWSNGRVTLVGDACYSLSPISKQGASMAMMGAYVLAEEINTHHNLSESLARYEQRMMPTVEEKQRAARRVAHLLVPKSRLQLAAQELVRKLSFVEPLASWFLQDRFLERSILQV